MIKKERQESILDILSAKRYCTVNYLSQQLHVAPITIRRDLLELEGAGLLVRCYGGATIPTHENREIPFAVRNRSNFTAKERLARQASACINTGDVVFLDASSTVSHIVDYLSPEQNLTVITNSTLVAEMLMEKRIRVYLTGGMPVENSCALVGSIAEQAISSLYANICFFSAQGVDEQGNITDQSEAETALRKLMIAHSQRQVFLFDSSKFQKRFAFRIGNIKDVTDVITDTPNRKATR